MAIGSFNAMVHDSTVKYSIAISHDGEQIAYGKTKWVRAFLCAVQFPKRLEQMHVRKG
ncbi:hypothetical protein AB4483_12085 [Vibrio splendidus]